MGTVPTVIRLTNKIQKQDYDGEDYPFCPLCLGPRDKLNNLLEIGSTIKSIKREPGQPVVVESVQSADEWFSTGDSEERDMPPIESILCFGCKRLCIETKSRNRAIFLANLPEFVHRSARRTWESDLQKA